MKTKKCGKQQGRGKTSRSLAPSPFAFILIALNSVSVARLCFRWCVAPLSALPLPIGFILWCFSGAFVVNRNQEKFGKVWTRKKRACAVWYARRSTAKKRKKSGRENTGCCDLPTARNFCLCELFSLSDMYLYALRLSLS